MNQVDIDRIKVRAACCQIERIAQTKVRGRPGRFILYVPAWLWNQAELGDAYAFVRTATAFVTLTPTTEPEPYLMGTFQ